MTDVEVLVVDNLSVDGDLLGQMCRRIGDGLIRVVEEKSLGLSFARNRAVQEAEGDHVLFLDDDTVPGPRLIEAYLNEIRQFQPDVLGGNVLGFYETKPGSWFTTEFWPAWSLKHFGVESRWLGDSEYFIGANIGARRTLLLEQPFDTELGRKGSKLLGGEEWFLGHKNFQRRFVGDAYVFHRVPPARMRPEYFARRRLGDYLTKFGKPRITRSILRSIADSGNALVAFLNRLKFNAAVLLNYFKLAREAKKREPGKRS
jgi:glycosyltransferase involved in cell wall biosynthesis